MTETRESRATSGHASGYLYGSAIERLLYWCSLQHGTNLEAKEPTKTLPDINPVEQKDGGLVINETAKRTGGRDPSIEAGEGVGSLLKDGRYNEAHDWPVFKRIFVAGIICLYTFVVYAASAIYIIGIPEMTLEFQIGEQTVLLGLSLYVLAYGLGPMLWAPLSEHESVGRSSIYAYTFLVFLCFSILAATVQSWAGFLAIRFLQGFFGSPCLAIGGASMHDLFPDLTVPYSLTVWVAAAYCGPALGPLIASYLVPEQGWRWGMWEIVWLAAPTMLLMLTLPETHGPTIRRWKHEAVQRQQAQSSSAPPKKGASIFGLVFNALRESVVRPVQITLLDPAVTVANFYTAYMYGTYYTFFDAIPRVYPTNYNFTTGQLGLAFLCIFAACSIGGAIYSVYIYMTSTAIQQDQPVKHEQCLRPALVASLLPPIGLFLFGWTSDGDIHWIVSLLGITIYATGTFIILQCLGVYLPRIYPDYSASLFAANDLCRSVVATAAIHVGIPLYVNLGIGPGVSVLGGMSVLGIPGMWFIYWKGPALRAKSRFVAN